MELPDSDRDDGTTAVRIDYLDCPANREVIRYDIVGGGHNAPGSPPAPAQLFRLLGSSNGDISAEALIWDFFNRHPGR
jgi:poly(3-hydroxybutyrate) depolymerase